MIRKIFLLSALWLTAMCAMAQDLKFGKNGEFKIVQFTDLHYCHGVAKSQVALDCVREVVKAEKPDLVVFTGDVIYNRPGATAMQDVLDCISPLGVPFVVLFGNHDRNEGGTPNEALYDQARAAKGNIQPDRKDAHGLDYVLRVKASTGDKTAAAIYCMDSHDYPSIKGVGTYDWIKRSQVDWYAGESDRLKAENGGQPLPALAYFHIPLPEYGEAARSESAILVGTRMEAACSPELNSGLFTAMKEQGDVMGMFVGHDHDNDYTVMWHDILLGYGRFTGGNTEYNHLRNGARVVVLEEGKRRFRTYVRLRGGDILYPTTYPDSYVKDDWRTRP